MDKMSPEKMKAKMKMLKELRSMAVKMMADDIGDEHEVEGLPKSGEGVMAVMTKTKKPDAEKDAPTGAAMLDPMEQSEMGGEGADTEVEMDSPMEEAEESAPDMDDEDSSPDSLKAKIAKLQAKLDKMNR